MYISENSTYESQALKSNTADKLIQLHKIINLLLYFPF